MKVHITLVGGQPMPVYHGIIASEPDKVIFIYSKNSKKVLNLIKPEVQTKNIPFEEKEVDPIDLNDIREKVQACANTVKDDDVSVNISSGTKPWAFYFAKVFGSMPNATIFYVDQNNVCWDMSGLSKKTIPFDMDALFRLRGNPLKFFKLYDSYTSKDKAAMAQFEDFRAQCYRHYKLTILNNLTALLTEDSDNQLADQQHGVFRDAASQSYVQWDKGKSVHIEITKDNNPLVLNLSSPHVEDIVFHSGWFELKVADILSRWSKAKKIRMNCLFPEKNAKDSEVREKLKNEIDIIVQTDSKPVFVECKAGKFNSTDINKFQSAVEIYGGHGSKSILITGGKLLKGQMEKLKEANIMYFSLAFQKEEALFELLDKNLYNTNI